MECVGPISCALEDLTDRLSNPVIDWGNFSLTLLATLIATAAGVMIGAFFGFRTLRAEQDERYEATVNVATAELMHALSVMPAAHREYASQYEVWAATSGNSTSAADRNARPREPDRSDVEVKLEILAMHANKVDRLVALALIDAEFAIQSTVSDPYWLATEYPGLRRIVGKWRSGERTPAQTMENLRIVRLRAEMRSDTDPALLPDHPEPPRPRVPSETRTAPML